MAQGGVINPSSLQLAHMRAALVLNLYSYMYCTSLAKSHVLGKANIKTITFIFSHLDYCTVTAYERITPILANLHLFSLFSFYFCYFVTSFSYFSFFHVKH